MNSTSWTEGLWVRLTLDVTGNRVRARIQRADNNQYLASWGVWQTGSTWALDVTDTNSPIMQAGKVGLGRSSPGYSQDITFDDFSVLTAASGAEAFDTTTAGAGSLPTGWAQWSSTADQFGVSTTAPLTSANSLTIPAGASATVARAWMTASQPDDVQVGAALNVAANQMTPAQLITRGSNLDTTTPTYYALEITRGLTMKLVKVVEGEAATFPPSQAAGVTSTVWTEGLWVHATLRLDGARLRAMCQRADTGQYLNDDGVWQTAAVWALDVNDNVSPITVGVVGLGRGEPGFSQALSFDNFTVTSTPVETFDTTMTGSGVLPSGWTGWTSASGSPFGVATGASLSGINGLSSPAGASSTDARAWLTESQPADVQVSASVNVLTNQINQARIFARSSGLNGTTPTYYALQVRRGLRLELVKVVNGSAGSFPGGSATYADTTAWTENLWVRPTLRVAGNRLQGQVQRVSDGYYLSPAGAWQATPVWAIDVTDTTSPITQAGQVGVGRPSGYSQAITFDDFKVSWMPATQAPPAPPPVPGVTERFDGVTTGMPTGWSQWTSDVNKVFAVGADKPTSLPNGLQLPSVQNGRAWLNTVQSADVATSAAVYLTAPTQVFARGSNLNGGTPTYYAVQVQGSGQLSLVRVVNGVETALPSAISAPNNPYMGPTNAGGAWLYVTLQVVGNRLLVQVYNPTILKYLGPDANGTAVWWQTPRWALDYTDNSASNVTAAGYSGVGRPVNATAAALRVDDFSVVPVVTGGTTPGDETPPNAVAITPFTPGAKTGILAITASAQDDVGIRRVQLFVDNTYKAQVYPPVRYNVTQAWAFNFDTSTLADGTHTVKVRAYDFAGNWTDSSLLTITTSNGRTNLLRHYDHIRVAQLAYAPTPIGSTEPLAQLVQNSVDLVVVERQLEYDAIRAASSTIPVLFYSNVSNIYLDFLLDWGRYADAHGYNREDAFYHVVGNEEFTGELGSTKPVRHFWGGYQYTASNQSYDEVAGYREWDSLSGETLSGNVGDAFVVGYPEKFAEINVTLNRAAAGTWNAAYEYSTGVDTNGKPTWAVLPTGSYTAHGGIQKFTDGTASGSSTLRQAGAVKFIPPTNWKAVPVTGYVDGHSTFLIRLRTTAGGGTTPIIGSLLADNYVNSTTGPWLVSGFDATADLDSNGFLDDYEFGPSGPDAAHQARFAYQSRMFAGTYGQMRFTTNPDNDHYREWAVDFSVRRNNLFPTANGLFIDNSFVSPFFARAPLAVMEPIASYADRMGSLLRLIDDALGTDRILPNVFGNQTAVPPLVAGARSYCQEFYMKPMENGFGKFEADAVWVADVAALPKAAWDGVIDSKSGPNLNLPAPYKDNSAATRTDPRVIEAVLANYYMLADPDTNLLDMFGGESTTTSWNEHWNPQIPFNVGRPQDAYSMFARGITTNTAVEPNVDYVYQVYQRPYQRVNGDASTTDVLVLYKPLPQAGAAGTGAAWKVAPDSVYTTHALPGTYRRLLADGVSFGSPITSINLRNGEGAILVKETGGGGGQFMMSPESEDAGEFAASAQGAARSALAYHPANHEVPLTPGKEESSQPAEVGDIVMLLSPGATPSGASAAPLSSLERWARDVILWSDGTSAAGEPAASAEAAPASELLTDVDEAWASLPDVLAFATGEGLFAF